MHRRTRVEIPQSVAATVSVLGAGGCKRKRAGPPNERIARQPSASAARVERSPTGRRGECGDLRSGSERVEGRARGSEGQAIHGLP